MKLLKRSIIVVLLVALSPILLPLAIGWFGALALEAFGQWLFHDVR